MKLWLFFLTFFLFAHAHAAWKVEVQHLPDNIKGPLLKNFPALETSTFSKSEMDAIIQWLHSNVGADRVTFSETSPGIAKLTVQRVLRIGEVKFNGLSSFSESEIRPYVLFDIGDPYNEPLLMETGNKILEYYHDQGFINAEVDIEMPTNEKGELILSVNVTENNQTEISKVILEMQDEDLKYELLKAVAAEGKGYNENMKSEIQQEMRTTLNKQGFYLAEIVGPETRFSEDESKVELIYKFNKLQRYIIEYKGNEYLTANSLNGILDMKNYSSANPNLAAELTQKLKNAYLEKGFARVELQSEESEGIRSNTKILTFMISEGSRIQIDRYEFNGRFSQDEGYYADFIKDNSTELINDGFYNSADLEKGINNLITHLQNQGHLLAKIVSKRTQYNRSKDRVTVYINLDEGPITSVDKIEFVGNSSFGTPELLKVLNLKTGAPLKLNDFESGIQRIKEHYFEHGFIDMVLTNEKVINESEGIVVYNEDNTLAQLKFHISEGPQVRVASIMIEGNYFTKDYVILNEIDMTIGDFVTPTKIEESISRLQRLGLFGSVDVRTLEEKTNVADRTLLVRVTEREPGEVLGGIGITNERGLTFRGYIGGAYRNLWGTGRALSLRVEGNYNALGVRYLEHRITAGYLEPYLFNTRYRGRLNVTRSKTITNYDARKGSEVNQATWSVEKNFTSHILGVWDVYSIATVKDFSIDGTTTIAENLLNIGSTGPTIDFDYLDNFLNPTRGTYTQLSAEFASPELGSTDTIRYWRATGTFKYFKKLAVGPWVWANSLRFGYLENLNENGGVPFDKKGFILGGRNTLRGYESGTDEVFPNSQDLQVPVGTEFNLTTRAKMGLIKTEIQFPLWGSFSGSVFYDGGYVEIHGFKFDDYYRDSAGIGIKYNTPVGPVNLEFGWKLDRRADEAPGRFHLSIGSI